MSFGCYIWMTLTFLVWVLIILLVNEMKIFEIYGKPEL